MGEANRRKLAGNGAGGGGTDKEMTVDEMIRNAAPDTAIRICPLPLMNYRPPHLEVVGAGKVEIPSLPCLKGQCMLYTEGLVQTDRGMQKLGVCGISSAGFALSQQLVPVVAQLGPTLGRAFAEVLVAHDEMLVTKVVDAVANVMADFLEEEEVDEPEHPGVQPAPVPALADLIPKGKD